MTSFDGFVRACHRMVTDARNGKSAKLLAAEVGKPYPTLLNGANPNNTDHKLGVELVAPLMRAAGDNGPAVFLARIADGAFVDLSEVRRSVRGCEPRRIMSLCLAATKEHGDIAQALGRALEDGEVLSRANLKELTHEIWECIEALVLLDEAAKAQAACGGNDGNQP